MPYCADCGLKGTIPELDAHDCRMKDERQTLGNILCDALNKQEITERLKQNTIAVEDRFIAKLYECVSSHYENGDRIGAEAILNAIQFAQQEQ